MRDLAHRNVTRFLRGARGVLTITSQDATTDIDAKYTSKDAVPRKDVPFVVKKIKI